MTTDLLLYDLAAADPDVRVSPHCWKTRLALAHKGLNPTLIPWRFVDKAAIAFSGQGMVPVLVDNGEVVTDSWHIAQYLEHRYPDAPSLFPGEIGVTLASFVNAWTDSVLLPMLRNLILVDVHACLSQEDQLYFRTTREQRLGQSLEAVVADRAQHSAVLESGLAPLRRALSKRPFICGTAPVYADYCVFGMFIWARCVSPVELLDHEDPVYVWRERLLDAFDGLARSSPRAIGWERNASSPEPPLPTVSLG